MVRRIRILLVDEMPRMLRDIVEHSVGTRPDMEIVAHVDRARELPSALGRVAADVALLCLDDADALASYDAVLYAHPRVQLLALAGDGRSASVYALRPHAEPLRVVTPDALVDAIRAAAATPV